MKNIISVVVTSAALLLLSAEAEAQSVGNRHMERRAQAQVNDQYNTNAQFAQNNVNDNQGAQNEQYNQRGYNNNNERYQSKGYGNNDYGRNNNYGRYDRYTRNARIKRFNYRLDREWNNGYDRGNNGCVQNNNGRYK